MQKLRKYTRVGAESRMLVNTAKRMSRRHIRPSSTSFRRQNGWIKKLGEDRETPTEER
jgi:hypothetical protein